MVDRQIVDEWLAKAEDDFRFAETVLSEKRSITIKSASTFSKALKSI